MKKNYTIGRLFSYICVAILLAASNSIQAQGVIAWGYTCSTFGSTLDYPNFNFFNFDVATGEPTLLAPASACTMINDFLTGEAVGGYYYTISNSLKELYRMTETGECSLVGAVSPSGNGGVTALSHDPSTGITYYVVGVPGRSELHTIDLNTGATTPINTNIPSTIISLPIDAFGNAFVIDAQKDEIIPIDLTTGNLGTAVGLNVNLDFNLDMDFDDTSNTLYGIYSTVLSTIYGILNPATGEFTEIRSLGTLTCGFSIGPARPALEELPVMSPKKGLLLGVLVMGIGVLLFISRMKL